MVRKVILIGFIGLLIALSNASTNSKTIATEAKTFTFNGKNVRAALKNVAAESFKYTPVRNKDIPVTHIFCPNTLTFYCKAGSAVACVSEDVTGSTFTISEEFEANAIFQNGESVIECDKVLAKNLVELSVFDFFSEAAPTGEVKKVEDLSEEEKKNAYCEMKNEKSNVKMVYVPKQQKDEKKVSEWKTIKKNLQNFRSSTKFTINGTEYTIKCENVDTVNVQAHPKGSTFWQRWRRCIIILGVLAAVIGVCYWFLCCDEDDDEEGKDENKAADP